MVPRSTELRSRLVRVVGPSTIARVTVAGKYPAARARLAIRLAKDPRPITIAIVGAGSRGTAYGRIASKAGVPTRVVAVAEPRMDYRLRLADELGVDPSRQFNDWREMASVPRLADAVVIATLDRDHAEPALAFAYLGYNILLEKPMATTEAACRQIVRAAKSNGVLLAVCHVMRYTPYTHALKRLLASKQFGEIASIRRLEPVGWWHFAHSYVRGSWRNENESSSMLLAKACHDVDWIRYMMGRRCLRVSSFGSLTHFRPEDKPEGAGDRCVTCPVEASCAYSALRFYTELLDRGRTGWPLDVLTAYPDRESIQQALRTGPYGRCVFGCDNDVVDHQVVNMEFEEGRTAAFTMTAFTQHRDRADNVFCTNAEINGDGRYLEIFDFLTERSTTVDTYLDAMRLDGHDAAEGHGGGDAGVVEAFIQAIARDDPSLVSNPEETLEGYEIVFAAERSRRSGRTVKIASGRGSRV
jgi:predicted dehydrogenase